MKLNETVTQNCQITWTLDASSQLKTTSPGKDGSRFSKYKAVHVYVSGETIKAQGCVWWTKWYCIVVRPFLMYRVHCLLQYLKCAKEQNLPPAGTDKLGAQMERAKENWGGPRKQKGRLIRRVFRPAGTVSSRPTREHQIPVGIALT